MCLELLRGYPTYRGYVRLIFIRENRGARVASLSWNGKTSEQRAVRISIREGEVLCSLRFINDFNAIRYALMQHWASFLSRSLFLVPQNEMRLTFVHILCCAIFIFSLHARPIASISSRYQRYAKRTGLQCVFGRREATRNLRSFSVSLADFLSRRKISSITWVYTRRVFKFLIPRIKKFRYARPGAIKYSYDRERYFPINRRKVSPRQRNSIWL